MKRRRRLFTPWRLRVVQAMAYGGDVIPPRSVIRAKEFVSNHFGRDTFRIGYYSRQDGLNCVWLVNADGKYEQTADQRFIRDSFYILERSDETDLYGDERPALQAFETVA